MINKKISVYNKDNLIFYINYRKNKKIFWIK